MKAYFENVPDSFHYISDYLDVSKIVNENIGIVTAKNEKQLIKILKTNAKRDKVYDLFSDLYRDIISNNKDVFVDIASWKKIVNSKKRSNNGKIYFLSLINPNLFTSIVGNNNIVLLGANIHDGMLYQWFSRYHRIKGKEYKLPLRPENNVSRRLKISYFFKKNHWSKYFRDRYIDDNSSSNGDAMCNVFKNELENETFLLIDNCYHKTLLDNLSGARRIDVITKGMNEFKSYTKLVHIPALNREPKHLSMLKDLGFDIETVHNSTSNEILYQNIMRTALRDHDSNEIVEVYVPTENEAKWLVGVFNTELQLRYLGEDNHVFEKFAPLNNLQRSKNKRAKSISNSILSPNRTCIYSNFNYGYCFTFSSSVNVVNIKKNFIVHRFNDLNEFASAMKTLSHNVISNKEDACLINPIIYKTDNNGKVKLKVNFIQSSMMVLDFDNGIVSKDDFIDIFWRNTIDIQKRCFIICNSFSRCKEKPNKFRVFLPYLKPAMSLDEHKAIFESILNRISQHFPDNTLNDLGIDKTCVSGVQSFYVPSTNRRYPEYAFFEKYGFGKGANRYMIDPSGYLRTSLTTTEKPVIVSSVSGISKPNDGLDKGTIQHAKDTYKAIPIGQGLRNKGLFDCGMKLKVAGLSNSEIRSNLYELAGNEVKIQRRVDGIITFLFKNDTFFL